MLILILVACLTLSWSVTCVRINYYLQSVVLTGFVFFSQFFLSVKVLISVQSFAIIKNTGHGNFVIGRFHTRPRNGSSV